MNVRVPAVAPMTPPDMGASTKVPEAVVEMVWAMRREVWGSMVEWSMKRRDGVVGSRGEARMESKTEVMCVGDGRARWMVVCVEGKGFSI